MNLTFPENYSTPYATYNPAAQLTPREQRLQKVSGVEIPRTRGKSPTITKMYSVQDQLQPMTLRSMIRSPEIAKSSGVAAVASAGSVGSGSSFKINKKIVGNIVGLAVGGAMGAFGAGLGLSGLQGTASLADTNAQMAKTLNSMRYALSHGGRTRRQDFQHNPMMSFSRPRVRAGHLGATGGLTLALNRTRTR